MTEIPSAAVPCISNFSRRAKAVALTAGVAGASGLLVGGALDAVVSTRNQDTGQKIGIFTGLAVFGSVFIPHMSKAFGWPDKLNQAFKVRMYADDAVGPHAVASRWANESKNLALEKRVKAAAVENPKQAFENIVVGQSANGKLKTTATLGQADFEMAKLRYQYHLAHPPAAAGRIWNEMKHATSGFVASASDPHEIAVSSGKQFPLTVPLMIVGSAIAYVAGTRKLGNQCSPQQPASRRAAPPFSAGAPPRPQAAAPGN